MKPIGTQNYQVKTILMLLEQINVLQLVLQASIFVSVLIQSIKVVRPQDSNCPNTMSRLFLLFVAGMIFAAHSSLIPKVCQFLKLDYLKKRLKLYAWLHELKELCHHFLLLSDYPLLKSLLRTTSRHKNRLVFCYRNIFL